MKTYTVKSLKKIPFNPLPEVLKAVDEIAQLKAVGIDVNLREVMEMATRKMPGMNTRVANTDYGTRYLINFSVMGHEFKLDLNELDYLDFVERVEPYA